MKLSRLNFLALLLVAAPLYATSWTVDDTHSTARFKIRHLGISNVSGEITGIKGKLEADDADVTKTKLEATLDTKTINTNNKKRDDHLRAPDFFDAKKFPTIKFVSKKVETAGDKLKITGDLTMHGVTKEAVLDADKLTAPVKDPWGNTRRGFTASTKLNRKDFGLTYGAVLETGGLVVGEEVDVQIEAEFVQAAPPAKKS